MKDRIKKYYRDVLTGVLMTISLALTFFMTLNCIRLVNIIDEKNSTNTYVQKMYAEINLVNEETGVKSIDKVKDVDFAEVFNIERGNVSYIMGTEIGGMTSYSTYVQYVIACNEEYDGKLIKGELCNGDFRNGNVLISENMLKYIVEKDEKQYIEVAGELYKVSGVLENTNISEMEKTVVLFVEGMTEEQKEKFNERIIADSCNGIIEIGSNKYNVTELFNGINLAFNKYGAKLMSGGSVLRSEEEEFARTVNRMIQPVLILFSFVNVYVITGIWVRRRLNECAVRKSFGASYGMIMCHLLLEMFKCVCVALVLSMTLQLIYLRVSGKTFVFAQYITDESLKIMSMVMIIIIIILFCYGKLIKKTEPVTAIHTM